MSTIHVHNLVGERVISTAVHCVIEHNAVECHTDWTKRDTRWGRSFSGIELKSETKIIFSWNPRVPIDSSESRIISHRPVSDLTVDR